MKQNLGENIRYYRRGNHLTQMQLSQFLGVSHQAVSKWESGGVYPDVMQLPKIANVLGISIDDLFGVESKERNNDIQKILNSANRMVLKQCFEEAEEILSKGLVDYPESYPLLTNLESLTQKITKARKKPLNL